MKKKRNFLTIISSILGVLTICSFSMFSIFNRSDKKTNSVSAVSINTLYSQSYSGSTNLNSDNNVSYTLHYNYSIAYNRYFDTSVTYGFNVNLTYYYSMVYDGTTYYCRPNVDTTSQFNVIFGSNLTTEPISSGSEISLRFNDFIVHYEFINFTWYGYSTFSLYLGNNQIGTSYSGTSTYFNFVNSSGLLGVFGYAENYSTTNKNISFSSFSLVYVVSQYDSGFEDGYDSGFQDGFSSGSTQGYNDGYSQGYIEGLADLDGQIQDSYQSGYTDGYNEGFSADSTATTIISGIFQVALVPINFFLGIFNFEILGINFSSLIQALFTIAITIIIVKSVFGNKGD